MKSKMSTVWNKVTGGRLVVCAIAMIALIAAAVVCATPTMARAADIEPRLSYRTASVVDTYCEKHEWYYPYQGDVRISTYEQTYKTIQYWDGYYVASVSKRQIGVTDLSIFYYCVNNWSVY